MVKYTDLGSALPDGMTRIGPAQRKALNARRALDYAHRYTS